MTPKQTPTPTVASRAAGAKAGRISFQFVESPPSARMSTRAAKPMACAAAKSLKLIPNPIGPSSMPTSKNSNSAGRPRRVPIRAAKAASSTTTAPRNRARSAGCMTPIIATEQTGSSQLRAQISDRSQVVIRVAVRCGGNDCHHNAGAKSVTDRLHESEVNPPEHKKLKDFLGDFIDHRMSQWSDNPCQHPRAGKHLPLG